MNLVRLPILEISQPSATPAPTAAPSGAFEAGPRSISAVRVLRISVTDRCNFRCVYCMPEEGVRWLPKEDILSFEEIRDVVRAAIEVHGIRRFKLTGGEPTIRHGITDLVRMLRKVNGIEDLSLTTNGFLLEELAQPLLEAGLDRVTVSIDSLKPDRFRRITRTGDLAAVLRGLDRAEAVGLRSLKINCVTMRGTNDDEFADFGRLSLTRQLTVRFIEYMPLGDAAVMHASDGTGDPPVLSASELRRGSHGQVARATAQVDGSEIGPAGGCGAQDRGADAFISETQVRDRIERELGLLLPVDRRSESGVGPANVYRLAHGDPLGRIGFISAMSAPFCDTCNRLRLTANGVLRSCLFEGGEVDIRPILRGASTSSSRPAALAAAMTDCVRLKPEVHSQRGNEQMSRIGG
ncbi:MAG: GTP 3',8-cyclase MoaA [Planctomycetota bacterium]|nr:GTP 3',8-cyclase MoaA [Planctomycetota bacterium]